MTARMSTELQENFYSVLSEMQLWLVFVFLLWLLNHGTLKTWDEGLIFFVANFFGTSEQQFATQLQGENTGESKWKQPQIC